MISREIGDKTVVGDLVFFSILHTKFSAIQLKRFEKHLPVKRTF